MTPIKTLGMAVMSAWLAMGTPTTSVEPIIEPQEPSVNTAAQMDLLSSYMFRGYTYSEGAVAQFVPTVNYGDVTLIGFANYDYETKDFNETDLTVDITKSIGPLSLSGGYTYLVFPSTDINDTQEIYASASLNTILNPTITIIRDIDDVDGGYYTGSVQHGFENVIVSALLAYNDQFLREESGITHAEFKADIPIEVGEGITMVPTLRYNYVIDDSDMEDTLYGGVSINIEF